MLAYLSSKSMPFITYASARESWGWARNTGGTGWNEPAPGQMTRTLLMGGIPIWRKVDEKTNTQSIQAEYFARLYDRKSPDPSVEILQHHMNYSFLGAKIAASSLTNFGTVVLKVREIFPQAIFDNRLAKPSVLTTSSSQVWQDIETNCKLIYLFHAVTSGRLGNP